MSAFKRSAIAASVLSAALASGLAAQIPGMPLFTNPRFATGIRVHADIGQPTDKGTQLGGLTVFQGGVSLALGPLGIGANVGMLRNDIKNLSGCTGGGSGCDPKTKATASGLLQLRLMRGNLLSLSVFGGGSVDLTGYDASNTTLLPQATRDSLATKQVTIPVGAALGVHVDLGVIYLNLWGAPRMNFTKYIHCGTTNQAVCDASMDHKFRWAVGADIPLMRILSLRAAYDTGKIGTQTVSYWGVGASIGFGGVR